MKTYSAEPVNEKMVRIPCNLCSCRQVAPYLTCDKFAFVKCPVCGMIYQNPQPDFSELKQRYRDNYFDYEITNEENFFSLMKLGLKDIHFPALAARYPRERCFLDIGCATGMLLAHMREQGWQVRGVDICRESAEYGIRKRGVDIYIGPLSEAGFPSASFHVIHFSHLIEHVPDPSALLREVHRLLTPDGIIIVTTPNAAGFQARLLGKNWRSAIADHVFLFTPKTLVRLLTQTGFVSRKFVTWGGIAKGVAPTVIKKPLDFLAKKWNCGDVMLVLAEKEGFSQPGV